MDAPRRAVSTRRSIPALILARCAGDKVRAKRLLPSDKGFIGIMATTLCSSLVISATGSNQPDGWANASTVWAKFILSCNECIMVSAIMGRIPALATAGAKSESCRSIISASQKSR